MVVFPHPLFPMISNLNLSLGRPSFIPESCPSGSLSPFLSVFSEQVGSYRLLIAAAEANTLCECLAPHPLS
jgi:hypothetical protein